MNFLAHIYLSNNDQQITIGNFIADGIRGKRYKKFPIGIQKGILLHRQIDTYTDAHPIVRKSTKRLHKNYGHYSGVIVDILYDHFLAKNWRHYSEVPLAAYVENFYALLQDNFDILPNRIQRMLPHMIADNWLLSYAKIEGIQKVLDGMNRRTQNKSGMHTATDELKAFYSEFESEFTRFFSELITFSENKLQAIDIQFQNEI
ncbi:acyl carrier protein phosphodiesterase [Psychroserpens sp. BH13MA-6]